MAYIENARRDLLKRTETFDEKKPRVYIGGIGFRGTQGIESTDASYFPLVGVRAKNLAKESAPKGHLFVEKEKILSWDPDLVFLDGGGLGNIRQDFQKKPEFFRNLKAFRTQKVHVLFPYNWYVTNIDTAIADGYVAGKISTRTPFKTSTRPGKPTRSIPSFSVNLFIEIWKRNSGRSARPSFSVHKEKNLFLLRKRKRMRFPIPDLRFLL